MIALLRMSAGLIVWAIAFCVLYGLHGIGCSAGWASGTVAGIDGQRLILSAAWIACLLAGAVVAFATAKSRAAASLVDRTAWWIALVGLAATAFAGVPILMLPSCL